MLSFSINLFGQINSPQIPIQSRKTNSVYQNLNQSPSHIHKNNLEIQLEKRNIITEIYQEIKETDKTHTINYNPPSFPLTSRTTPYHFAFQKLTTMSDSSYSIQKAIFLVENAYYENQGDFTDFNKVISEIGHFLRWKMEELNYDENSNIAKNLILFQFFSDTLKIEPKNLEHLPFQYDFDDYLGDKNWENMFISKLLRTNKGQCHSLPLLYMILAEEIGANAHLSFSPNHSYIKFQDDNGKWINIELTNGMLTTDAFILQSGYIKAEALQNKIYMQPISKKQLLSAFMVDLAKGYANKFGYDQFVINVIEKAIELYPNNINAQLVKSDLKTMHFFYVQKQLNVGEDKIQHYPKAKALLDEMYAQYKLVDKLGFEKMPMDDYEKWLSSLNEAKSKQDNKQLMLKLNKLLD